MPDLNDKVDRVDTSEMGASDGDRRCTVPTSRIVVDSNAIIVGSQP
jgi:hypothetical protein